MASKQYRFLAGERERRSSGFDLELHESDVWNSRSPENMPDLKKSMSNLRIANKTQDRMDLKPSSCPVSIPNWSKILREDCRKKTETDLNEQEDDDDVTIPPHMYLAKRVSRTPIGSFSVHEGIGRTLKGRDLSRVRDAIWKKTGFQD